MAILEAVLSQTYQNQQIINRWYYVSSGTPVGVSLSLALCSAMGLVAPTPPSVTFPDLTIGVALQALQHTDVTFVSTAVRDLYSDSDFYESAYPSGIFGTAGGTAASPALAYGFFTDRVRQSVRRGAKRIVGVSEDAMGAGGVLVSPFIVPADTLATRMGETLAYTAGGNSLTFVPAVLSFESYTTPSGRVAYRPYATEAEQLARTAQGVKWSFKPNVRTQVSRQYGRGS